MHVFMYMYMYVCTCIDMYMYVLQVLLAEGAALPSLLSSSVVEQSEVGEECPLSFHLCQIISHAICQPKALSQLLGARYTSCKEKYEVCVCVCVCVLAHMSDTHAG